MAPAVGKRASRRRSGTGGPESGSAFRRASLSRSPAKPRHARARASNPGLWAGLFLILLFLFPVAGCDKLTPGEFPGSGCVSDADCREGRVCRDRICLYPEEAERLEPAEALARRVLESLAESEPRRFVVALPLEEDYRWAFRTESYAGSPEDTHARREAGLLSLFAEMAESGAYEGAEFVSFTAGRYAPVPEGREDSLRGLDRLVDSRVRYRKGGEEKEMLLGQLIRFRNRWRLFSFER